MRLNTFSKKVKTMVDLQFEKDKQLTNFKTKIDQLNHQIKQFKYKEQYYKKNL